MNNERLLGQCGGNPLLLLSILLFVSRTDCCEDILNDFLLPFEAIDDPANVRASFLLLINAKDAFISLRFRIVRTTVANLDM